MKEKTSISQKLQKFGSVLAGMVIPNIGAFIGFGLITAVFLETGWTPNAKLAKLISPILNYLLPILIGHTGGKMFGGDRGGVIGALVTMGAIVAVDGTPMFLAAMILGPVAGVCIKKFDQAVDGKIPAGVSHRGGRKPRVYGFHPGRAAAQGEYPQDLRLAL